MRRGKRKIGDYGPKININEEIRASELRVIFPDGKNVVMAKKEAIEQAKELGFDLIEVSANVVPPIAKITDYGQHQYEQKKKRKEIKAKAKTVEVKSIQIKIGTGENDMMIKADAASKWLRGGDRVKIELFLPGRSKYMDKKFLHDRLRKVLPLIKEEHVIVEEEKASPKGIIILIEAKNKTKDGKKN